MVLVDFEQVEMTMGRPKKVKRTDGKPEPERQNLTTRQRTFAKHVAEGIYSNAECARKAGYSEKVAGKYADRLLNGRDYPLVTALVQELREERERRYGVTLIGQLERLAQLSKGAEDVGQFSAAISAEKMRAALGGLTTDRREIINKLDDMSRADMVARLVHLQEKYPQLEAVLPMKDVTPAKEETDGGTRSELLEYNAEREAEGRTADPSGE